MKQKLYKTYLRLIKERCIAQRKLIEAVKKETLAFVAYDTFGIKGQVRGERNGLR